MFFDDRHQYSIRAFTYEGARQEAQGRPHRCPTEKTIRDIAWEAQVRLCARYRRLKARGKTTNIVNVAIAREMVGFIWPIACTMQTGLKAA